MRLAQWRRDTLPLMSDSVCYAVRFLINFKKSSTVTTNPICTNRDFHGFFIKMRMFGIFMSRINQAKNPNQI